MHARKITPHLLFTCRLVKFFILIWRDKSTPEEWKTSLIIKLPKKTCLRVDLSSYTHKSIYLFFVLFYMDFNDLSMELLSKCFVCL